MAMMSSSPAMPNSSSGVSGSCVFCAASSTGSFATSAAQSKVGRASDFRSWQQRQRGWKLYWSSNASARQRSRGGPSLVTNNRPTPGGQFVHAKVLPDNP
jgi:hypothetical protein